MICEHDVMSKKPRYIMTILFNLDIFDNWANNCFKYTMAPHSLNHMFAYPLICMFFLYFGKGCPIVSTTFSAPFTTQIIEIISQLLHIYLIVSFNRYYHNKLPLCVVMLQSRNSKTERISPYHMQNAVLIGTTLVFHL